MLVISDCPQSAFLPWAKVLLLPPAGERKFSIEESKFEGIAIEYRSSLGGRTATGLAFSEKIGTWRALPRRGSKPSLVVLEGGANVVICGDGETEGGRLCNCRPSLGTQNGAAPIFCSLGRVPVVVAVLLLGNITASSSFPSSRHSELSDVLASFSNSGLTAKVRDAVTGCGDFTQSALLGGGDNDFFSA